MTPEFSSLVNPTMHYVLDLVSRIQRQATGIDLRQERDHIRGELEAAAATADGHDSPVSGEEFRLAKQGLIYWIDEVMTIADPAWQTMTLEWHYFQSLDRAWKFYVDGERQALRSSPDVIELWYLALVLGFEGDIRNAFDEHLNEPLSSESSDDQERQNWARKLERQIRQTKSTDLQPVPLQGNVMTLSGGLHLKSAAGWSLTLIAVAILLGLLLWRPDLLG
ncbi:MAG: hypothetical protein CMJ68_17400 [Planctomycetaceae bacterium]|nr:hypothetical protein [Planctomycetaceae bacterium]|tara:strand:+ start:3480 stop:4145 length:666 start_codon:yes stop_codon:yes gene_type:complete